MAGEVIEFSYLVDVAFTLSAYLSCLLSRKVPFPRLTDSKSLFGEIWNGSSKVDSG